MCSASLAQAESYRVRLEFTDELEPSLLSGEGLPFVSLEDEILANGYSLEGQELRTQYGRIPYGAPLYLWQRGKGDNCEILYIGMTVKMTPKARFHSHAAVVKLLADNVNVSAASVYFRLCSRFDLHYELSGSLCRRAIEHFSPDEAHAIVSDVEAALIHMLRPPYNSHFIDHEKSYGKPFVIEAARGIPLPWDANTRFEQMAKSDRVK